MLNQIKTEFYIFLHSKLAFVLMVLYLMNIFIFATLKDGTYFMYGTFENGLEVGFCIYAKENHIAYSQQDLINTLFSSSLFFSIIVLFYVFASFNADYINGSYKINVCYGIKCFHLYFSKIIVLSFFFFVYMVIYYAILIPYVLNRMNLKLDSSILLTILTGILFIYLIMLCFIIMSFFLCLLTQKTYIPAMLLCTWNFISMYSVITHASVFSDQPSYLKLNPMLYLMYLPKTANIQSIILLYSLGIFIIFIPFSIIVMKKRSIN